MCLAGLAGLLLGQASCGPPPPGPEAGVLEAGRRAFLAGDYRRAEEAYQYYLQAFPHGEERLEAWLRLADISQDVLESPRQAVALLEAALLEYGRDPEAAPGLLARAGALRQRLLEYEQATDRYRSLLALPGLAPDELVRACRALAQVRVLAKDVAGALETLRSCRTGLSPGDDLARLDLARADLFLRLDQGTPAEALFREIAADTGVSPAVRAEAGFLLGQRYEAGGEKDKALAVYENIRDTFPNPLVVDQRLGYLRR